MNVTAKPDTAFPNASFTTTAGGMATIVATTPFCGVVPATGVRLAGSPATDVAVKRTGARLPTLAES
jgi:hypothetical protein